MSLRCLVWGYFTRDSNHLRFLPLPVANVQGEFRGALLAREFNVFSSFGHRTSVHNAVDRCRLSDVSCFRQAGRLVIPQVPRLWPCILQCTLIALQYRSPLLLVSARAVELLAFSFDAIAVSMQPTPWYLASTPQAPEKYLQYETIDFITAIARIDTKFKK